MRMLAEFFPEFAEKLDELDELYAQKRTIDEKTYQFICFALSIKGRSKPCVLKHFKGALEAGATVEELTYMGFYRVQLLTILNYPAVQLDSGV